MKTKYATPVAAVLAFHFTAITACFASGYHGPMADAFSRSSIVVLGVPQAIDANGSVLEGYRSEHDGHYRLAVEKTYSETKVESVIEFIDLSHRSFTALRLRKDSRYVIFIQTPEDRTAFHHPRYADIGDALTGLWAIHADGDALEEVETGLAIVRRYARTPQGERNAFLMEHLHGGNKYAHSLIIREILREQIVEAIPYFRMKLSEASTEVQKLSNLNHLRILGEPNIRDVLIDWLADPVFTSKGDIIEEMVRLKDPSLIPVIERFVHAEDERIAVRARSALLRLGEPRAKELLFDMLNKSEDRIVRHNAIHVLNWNYSGEFSDGEKVMILALRKDTDEAIARIAGFIANKWEQ